MSNHSWFSITAEPRVPRIAADGTLDLHVPSDLPPGEADVVIVVQPAMPPARTREEPPYQSDYGVWRGKLPDIDIDAELREMNREEQIRQNHGAT